MGIFQFFSIVMLFIGLTFPAHSGIATQKRALHARKARLISPSLHDKLARAQSLMVAQKYPQALTILIQLRSRKNDKPHERAQVLQTLGYAYAQSGASEKAITELEQTLQLNALPATPTLNTMYTLAQLYLEVGQVDKSVRTMNQWFGLTKSITPSAYILIATGHAEKGQFKSALFYLNKLLASRRLPRESWLQFALNLYMKTENHGEAVKTLKSLCSRFPKRGSYWKQLSDLYLNLNQNREALAHLEMAYKLGHLKSESEIMNLIRLYFDQGIPLKAAQLMTSHMKKKNIRRSVDHLEILASAWITAKEPLKAEQALIEATTLATNGNTWTRLGQLRLSLQNWKGAGEAFEAALKKGDLKEPNEVHLNLGIARFQAGDYDAAQEKLERALREPSTRERASQWMALINQ